MDEYLERRTALSVVDCFVRSILDGERGPISGDKRALYEDVLRLTEWIPELLAEVGGSASNDALAATLYDALQLLVDELQSYEHFGAVEKHAFAEARRVLASYPEATP